MDGLQDIDDEMDLELMMEFRNTYWDLWVEFCQEKGFDATKGV